MSNTTPNTLESIPTEDLVAVVGGCHKHKHKKENCGGGTPTGGGQPDLPPVGPGQGPGGPGGGMPPSMTNNYYNSYYNQQYAGLSAPVPPVPTGSGGGSDRGDIATNVTVGYQ